MNTTIEHNSIHIPKYETEPIQFNTPTDNTSVDIADIQNFICEKAEKNLERCKSFEVSLPPSITDITDESNRVQFKSLFQTPTLNDLEIVSINHDGSSIKLNNYQLQSVKQTGEFEVNSIHFPGQNHRWKLNKLLQSGIQTANEVFFKELSWAVYMLLIFARDRIQSDRFSFKSTIQSWKQGFINLLDNLIGLPATTSKSINDQIENERKQFLVIELTPNENEKEMHKNFCEQVPILLKMMAEYNKNKNIIDQMLPYAHHFIAPDNIPIDLRLYNPNLQNEIGNIIYDLLSNNTPKNWFHTTKRRLINEYKHRQVELGLSKDEIAKCIQTDLNNEYTKRIFEIIETSDELEHLSPGLGQLLVEQARAILTMKSIVEKLNENLEKHLKLIREKLVFDHPIKSKITRWIDEEILNERIKYIHEHQWDAHQSAIEQCRTLGNHQAAYFIQRDLIFRRDHEANLRQNLKSPIEPMRTIYSNRSIWFSTNWIVERIDPLPIERIPTYFSDKIYSSNEEERRIALIKSDRDAHYQLRQHTTYSITTQYPFWRWKLFAIRIYCWLSNAIFLFCLVIPFTSPVSFRALFSTKSYTSNYYLKLEDLKLYGNPASNTQTFISRLVVFWYNIRKSRHKFEQIPDRGFLGKNMQRIFNRFWNYIGKGLVGTVAICAVYPVSFLSLSILSFILGILSPVWMPILTVVYHIGEILIYDADSAGKYSRKLFCLINTIITDFLGFGIIQPILVLISLLISPIISLLISIYALLHRCTQGFYDTTIYHLIIKRFARIPAHNGFLVRRISGPGLASEYFYQVSSIEVLAGIESLIEQNQLKFYREYVERILRKPINEYQQFFNSAFQPFAGRIQTDINSTIYEQMNRFVNEKLRQLQEIIQKRNNLLQLHRGNKHNRIRLTETDLTTVLIKGTQLVEKWYPNQILPYIHENDLEKFWNDHDLEPNNWFGLTNKLLQELFCREILTPLEQTDTFYTLKVDHLTLTKYVQMINSANLHDDLDVVTSVYMPETSYTIQQPIFDQQIFNPIDYRLDKSKIFENLHVGNHNRVRRFKSKPIDPTPIPYPYSISIKLPELICINIIIYKHNNDNSTTVSLKNISLQKIVQLIKYNQQFCQEPILPLPLSRISNNLLLHKKFL